jgi:hypothetical protein
MKILGGLGLALLLASGCGDLGSRAEARLASQVCDEMCGWPDQCFEQLGVPLQGADCIQTCEAQVEVVGIACVSAISSTIACLGTCDVQSLTQAELLECQDEALAIEAACE